MSRRCILLPRAPVASRTTLCMQSHSPPPFCVASWCFDPLHRLPQAEVHGQDRTLEKLQNELEDDVGACALREAQIRQSRQHDRELLGAQLDELAKRIQDAELDRQAAKESIQRIRVDAAAERKKKKEHVQALAVKLPVKMQETNDLREKIAGVEQQLEAMQGEMREAESRCEQLLRESSEATLEYEMVIQSTEILDGEIIKSVQKQHAMQCVMEMEEGAADDVNTQASQRLADLRDALVGQRKELQHEKRAIVAAQEHLAKMEEIIKRHSSRSKDFAAVHAQHIGAFEGDMGANLLGKVDVCALRQGIVQALRDGDIIESLRVIQDLKADYDDTRGGAAVGSRVCVSQVVEPVQPR